MTNIKIKKEEKFEDGVLKSTFYKVYDKDEYVYSFYEKDINELEQEIIRIKTINKN